MEKSQLKIVFFGTPDFAVESLRRMVEGGYNVVAAVTAPDKPAGRGKHLQMPAVKQYALEAGLPVMQPVRLKDEEFVNELRSFGADLFVVIAFRMLPEVVWTMPRFGTFNLHASLLPRYRGAAPINWAVINGDTRTGVTTFFLQHEIDTGDIIDREEIEILPTDDAGSVHDRLMTLGADLTVKTIDRILSGNLTSTPQSMITDAEPSPAPKIFKDTCHLDFSRPAREVHNLVRGLSPYPTAWAELCESGDPKGTLKIFTTAVAEPVTDPLIPGRVTVSADLRLWVDCADGRLELLSVQAQGKRRMPVADFLRGCRLTDMSLR